MFRYWPEGTPEAENFSTVLVGLFSEATQGAADPNELLRVAGGIRSGNREDWTRSFLAMGEQVAALAEEAGRQRRMRTASDAHLRAFTYFRVAELMCRYGEPQKIPLYRRALDSFRNGMSLSAHRHEPVSGTSRCRLPSTGTPWRAGSSRRRPQPSHAWFATDAGLA
jgi:hypothetical protein